MQVLYRTSHSFGEANYHLQFTPKYRVPVFRNYQIREGCRDLFRRAARNLSIDIVALDFGPDHVHIFVARCKNYSVAYLARRFKGYVSRYIWRLYPDELRGFFWSRRKFWSSGYFHETVGAVTTDVCERYVKTGQRKHWVSQDQTKLTNWMRRPPRL